METVSPSRRVASSEPDLSQLRDEQLAFRVQESDQRPARDELLVRTLQQRTILVRRLTRGAGLSKADQSDVHQDAILWTLEAIQRYDCASAATAGGCSFRSFLHRVVTCRFIDFIRLRLRYRRHFVLIGVAMPQGLDRSIPLDRSRLSYTPTHPDESEQQQELEEQELNNLLQRQLDRLSVRTRLMWELLTRGASVLEVAAALHISYDAAKRRRRKLLSQLRRSLTAGRGLHADQSPHEVLVSRRFRPTDRS